MNADIIIDPDGSVWVSAEPINPGTWISFPTYFEIEEIQREDFDSTRGARGGRPSRRYGYGYRPGTYREPRGYDHFSASDDGARDNSLMNAFLNSLRNLP